MRRKPAFAFGTVTVFVVDVPPDGIPVANTFVIFPEPRFVDDKILYVTAGTELHVSVN